MSAQNVAGRAGKVKGHVRTIVLFAISCSFGYYTFGRIVKIMIPIHAVW